MQRSFGWFLAICGSDEYVYRVLKISTSQ